MNLPNRLSAALRRRNRTEALIRLQPSDEREDVTLRIDDVRHVRTVERDVHAGGEREAGDATQAWDEDAGDCIRFAVEEERLAYYRRVGAEVVLPERVREDCEPWLQLGACLGFVESAA